MALILKIYFEITIVFFDFQMTLTFRSSLTEVYEYPSFEAEASSSATPLRQAVSIMHPDEQQQSTVLKSNSAIGSKGEESHAPDIADWPNRY